MEFDATKPTLYYQESLPKLPIPKLEDTLAKYLRTLQPLLDTKDYERVKKIVADFQANLGVELQRRLLEHAKTAHNSWLEKWWLEYAYHGWRESVMINSNWFVLFKDHPNSPAGYLEDGSPQRPKQGIFTAFQIQRAAQIVTSYVAYNELIKSQKVPVDGSSRTGPQCMNQYYQLFGVTRVPRPGVDQLERHPNSKHIAVLARDQIFIVPVYNSKDGKPYSEQCILELLTELVHKLERDFTKMQPAISMLTCLHRDRWAVAHSYLASTSLINASNLAKINSALFFLCLDDYSVTPSADALGRNAFHGVTGHNRWFDKSMSLVVTSDGRAGKNGEHSPCDALIPSLIVRYAVEQERTIPKYTGVDFSTAVAPKCAAIERLYWKSDETIQGYLHEANLFASALIANSQLASRVCDSCGFQLLKKLKISPDAFVQMALQAAYYEMHGSVTPVYETAATRSFFHGRTETCRSLSNESKEFALALSRDPSLMGKKELAALLDKAIKAHNKYIAEASMGKGIDRHLLGLKLSLRAGELAKANIYTDRSYTDSMWFRLSTSALPYTEHNIGTGFGAVVPDGYGINYVVGPTWIRFGIESKVADPNTDSVALGNHLAKVLDKMRQIVCSAVQKESKL